MAGRSRDERRLDRLMLCWLVAGAVGCVLPDIILFLHSGNSSYLTGAPRDIVFWTNVGIVLLMAVRFLSLRVALLLCAIVWLVDYGHSVHAVASIAHSLRSTTYLLNGIVSHAAAPDRLLACALAWVAWVGTAREPHRRAVTLLRVYLIAFGGSGLLAYALEFGSPLVTGVDSFHVWLRGAAVVLALIAGVFAANRSRVRRAAIFGAGLVLCERFAHTAWNAVMYALHPPSLASSDSPVGNLFHLAAEASALALIVGALLWYWWPVLTGRRPAKFDALRTDCRNCGYDLTGNLSGRCPECGSATACESAAASVTVGQN